MCFTKTYVTVSPLACIYTVTLMKTSASDIGSHKIISKHPDILFIQWLAVASRFGGSGTTAVTE